MHYVFKGVLQKKSLQILQSELKPSEWIKRLCFGLILSVTFFSMFFMGPLYISAGILLVQVICYVEVLNIVIKSSRNPNVTRLKATAWYLLLVWNYYLSGETFNDRFRLAIQKNVIFDLLLRHSRFKSFCLYFAGVVLFVFGLRDKYNASGFKLLALMHILLMLISLQAYMFLRCLLDGLIWILVPIILVMINDVFAYIFGKFFGKTLLIRVSPKKTREGFACAAICTVLGGMVISNYLSSVKYFICPTEYNALTNKIEVNLGCTPMESFQEQNYHIFPGFTLTVRPFVIHCFWFSLFASIIAPFGGFFASGFKRAFNVKDFSNIIPGHGGFSDRFDCQLLMVMFVYTYMSSFIKNTPVTRIFKRVMNMNEFDQIEFYMLFQKSLAEKQLL